MWVSVLTDNILLMSISPIYTAAFSSIPMTRGVFADRTFGGTTEETRNANHSANSANAASALSGQQTVQGITPTDSAVKSVERKQGYPEKSTDSDKKRSLSGDILDLSGSTGSKVVENAKKSEKAESSAKSGELTAEEQQQVDKLKLRDAEVRTHEAAHMAAAGRYVQGGPSYTYQTGPDGKQYAIGGSVSIDVSPVAGDPQATLQKAQQVRAAALAPAEPSGQDQKVAAAASQMEADARLQLAREKTEKTDGDSKDKTPGPFGSLNIESDKAVEKESGQQSNNIALESSAKDSKEPVFASALSSRRNSNTFGAASAYQQVQDQTAGGRSFAAYA